MEHMTKENRGHVVTITINLLLIIFYSIWPLWPVVVLIMFLSAIEIIAFIVSVSFVIYKILSGINIAPAEGFADSVDSLLLLLANIVGIVTTSILFVAGFPFIAGVYFTVVIARLLAAIIKIFDGKKEK